MRRIALVMLVVACGNKESGTGSGSAEKAPDAAPWKPVVGPLAGIIPTAPRDLPAVSGPAPVSAVFIDADGTLRAAATRGSWETVNATWFHDRGTVVASADALPGALLAILGDPGGPVAAQAAEMREELEAALFERVPDPGPIGLGEIDEIDIAFTYAAAPGTPPTLTTPLLLVHPGAPAEKVLAVVDLVGGTFVVADGDELALLPTTFPWENGAWGGADLGEDERPSLDVQIGADRLAFVNQLGGVVELGLAPGPLTEELKARLEGTPPAPEPVIDAMVTPEATAQHLVAALGALDAAGAPRLGVAVSPWPFVGRP